MERYLSDTIAAQSQSKKIIFARIGGGASASRCQSRSVATPPNPANIRPATGSLAQALQNAPDDPDFDLERWTREWSMIENEMKAITRSNSIADNELQVEEIENLMDNWGQASYDSVAHCIVDHANRHGFPGEYLKYLRKADHFNKKRSKKRTPEPGVTRWKKHSGEYLIERDGKIVSYSLK